MNSLAYLISTFPKASETFVYREILLLQKLNQAPILFACLPPSQDETKKLNIGLIKLKQQTFYLEQKASFIALLKHPILSTKLAKKAYALNNKATNNHSFPLMLARAVLLAVQLKKNKITHLHAHWPYSTMIGYLATQIYPCRFSVSIHAHEVAHENGHFSTIFPSLKFASFCNQAAMDFLMKNISYTNEARAKSHLIYHGVNIEDFPFLPLKQITDRINVISAGRLTSTKGFHRLVEGCAKAKQNGINVHLTILGTGPEHERIEEAAKQFNYTENLHMAGWVPHEKVKDFIQEAHVFAIMADTTYHDGLPNVVLESMAEGRPVIISPLPAATEAVENGKEGFILTLANDVDGFAKHIAYLYNHFQVLKEMGIAARKRIENEHADYIHIKKLAALFNA